ncbi:MAG: FKBP-type peptidyl-prolyl cis-trans isomerase [Salinivirgaceae bacterium]
MRLIKIVIGTFLSLFFLSTALMAQEETLKLYKNNKKRWLKTLSTSSSGLRYTIENPGEGMAPRPGDLVKVHYVGVLENDSVFSSSYDQGKPLEVNYGVGQVIQGWDEGIGFLREGGTAILVVPPNLGYGDRSNGRVPPNSTLYFRIELIEVKRNEAIQRLNTAGKDTVALESGIQYIVVKEGEGAKADENHWAYFHFIGYLPSGKIFDASTLRGDAVRYNAGSNDFIPAFDQVLPLMNQGAQYHVLVPSKYAYGKEGLEGVVPPDTDLKFDIDLQHVEEKKEIIPFDVDGRDTIVTPSGVKYMKVKEGEGEFPKENDVVKIHFTGYFENGNMFQSSLSNNDDVIFAVGQGQVIVGLDEVIKFVKPGGKIRAIIPWKFGYGEEGYPPLIPPKTNLVFDIELVAVAE